jgi:hypothetical protein
VSTSDVNLALARLLRRAEEEDPKRLAETFVDVGAILTRISTRDNQIIFGRRGTGKTHALAYLAETRRAAGDTVVNVDLRLIGSSGGIYNDPTVPLSEAGTRLLLDVLERLHEDLVDFALSDIPAATASTSRCLPALDKLADAITEVIVVGEVEARQRAEQEDAEGSSGSAEGGLSLAGAHLRAIGQASQHRRALAERELLFRGVARHRLHFGAVGSALRRLVPTLPGKRLWVLLDEWSHVPIHLQPLLADLLRHCVLPIPGLTVKIAAIDHRSLFKVDREDSSYVGFEVGADVQADVDLDDFMAFSSDADAAIAFFAQLLQRHVNAAAADDTSLRTYPTPEAFVSAAFASDRSFAELVRAAEGIPRDAINIVGKAALQVNESRISLSSVREAAHRWYVQDKEGAVKSRPDGLELLHWMIDRVVGSRRARGFLLEQGGESPLVDWLYDSRVLHLVKRNVSSNDRPGLRYDVYAVDYGCYVDLLTTQERAPIGLLPTDDDEYLDVPPSEYSDSMRSAILDLRTFETRADLGLEQRAKPIELMVRSAEMKVIPIGDVRDDPLEHLTVPGWYLLLEHRERIAAIHVGRRQLRLGNASGDQIRLTNANLAPSHAILSRADPILRLSARGSDPVYVNGLRSRETTLADRDNLKIGDVTVVVVQVRRTDE